MRRFKMPDVARERTPLLAGHAPMASKKSKKNVEGREEVEGRQPPPSGPVRTSPLTSLLHYIKQAGRGMTLEPVLFIKMVAEGNFKVVADTLEVDRICLVSLNFSRENCNAMDDGNHSDVQTQVQRTQNIFNYHQSLMDSILPLLIVAFAGSLSDRYGRKPAMLVVMAGFVALAAVYLLEALRPSWPVQVLYIGTLVVDMTGSWVVFNMAVYSYMADITTPETRTRRLATVDACWYLGGPLGQVLGGWLYRSAGEAVVFLVSGALWILAFFYLLLLVPESVQEAPPMPPGCKRCGPLRHLVDLAQTAFGRRAGRGRLHLLLLMVVMLMVTLCQGHQMYLWARRVLVWDVTQFSNWSSLDSLLHQAGMLVWVWFAAQVRLSDYMVAVGGLVSLALWSSVLACITRPGLWWLTIVASVAGSLEASIEPAIRTLLTTVGGPGRAGRVLALTGFLQAAFFAVDRSLYTFTYNTYVDILPQINFLIQSSWCLLTIVILLALRLNLCSIRNTALAHNSLTRDHHSTQDHTQQYHNTQDHTQQYHNTQDPTQQCHSIQGENNCDDDDDAVNSHHL